MKREIYLKSVFVLLAIFLIIPNSALSGLKPGQPIIIGVATFLGHFEGAESLKTVTLAVEEINAKGGVSIKGSKHPLKVEASDIRDGAPGFQCLRPLWG